MKKIIPFVLAAVAVTPAAASTPQAWGTMHIAARRACITASGLRAASASEPLDFADTGGAKTAVLVRGTYTQRFMKGASGTFLCLYDRRTKKAEAVEAPGFVLDEKAASKN